MRLKAIAFGPIVGAPLESDIKSLSFDGATLLITVACELDKSGHVRGLEIEFDCATAFRYLDEADLARYWVSKEYPRGSYVLEVQEGGWSEEENELQQFDFQRREWLVGTGNGCVSVFCPNDPQIKTKMWQRET